MKSAGGGDGHIFQALAPTGTTTFLRETMRSFSRGKARGSISNAMNTYRWSRVSNLSFLTRCPRISCISLERESREVLSMNICRRTPRSMGQHLGEKVCASFR